MTGNEFHVLAAEKMRASTAEAELRDMTEERDELRAEVERLEADNELGRTDAQALRESLASARAEGKRLRATLGFIAGQQPCKPDYWSACPQCEHNVTICEDALEPTNTKGGD